MADDLSSLPEFPPPLAPYKGAVPEAPTWFDAAIAKAPERSMVTVKGAAIELLTWGQRGKPGLLLVHGNTAHADWWSFIAPILAEDYRVAAISMSGMGGSDWRERYDFETYADEMFEGAKAAGLYDDGQKPIYVGHSFGGAQVFYSATRHADRMRAAILVDTGFGGPPPAEEGFRAPETRPKQNRAYATLPEALARFRLMPPQSCRNTYIADFIARRSLKAVPLDGGGEGWTWRFDPQLWNKLDRVGLSSLTAPPGPHAPMVHVYGENSAIIQRMQAAERRVPADVPSFAIPDAEHHVMIDQPLALITALRGLLVSWP
ncbi:alpha/beta fold hydrolase [Phenylobacterium montanum]|uniref:Alpha/beta hydrolase n=1 Tax=Phenylobacterium montanum TaxID=2823693 RepID=A0A975FYS1_9CAUL|nr:alpha/beta hydrolase [Caulobacter sp. S6]QUD86786.1 alpha/beta hydrolase [Caulobacter sp. S6]